MGMGLIRGATIVLTRDVSLFPHAELKRGECGRIVQTRADAEGVYAVEIKMFTTHIGLRLWDNEVLLVVPELYAVAVRPDFITTMFRVAAYAGCLLI